MATGRLMEIVNILDGEQQVTASTIKSKRNSIMSIAESMKDIEQTDCPVTHRFADGCYLREILMPKGTVIVGKIHATEHFNVILTGEVTVATAEWVKRFKAPHTFISGAGVQKVVYIHEDCQWQTLHVTDKTDLDEIEKDVIVEDYDQLETDYLLNKCKGLL